MDLTRYERETTINFNEEEDTAIVYTCSKAVINKMDKLCSKTTLIYVQKQDAYSKWYRMPKRCISFRLPMQISNEKREERASRAQGLYLRRRRREP